MIDRRKVQRLLGETIRDIGILIVVFGPLDAFLIGHSVVARFRDYAPFSAVTRPIFAPPIFVSAGSLRLQWTGSGMLQQTDSLSPANWTSAPNQANPQNVSTTTGSKYYRIAP